MRRQELKRRKKVHAHKRSKKRWHMGASRKETTFVEYKPEVIIVKEMKTPRNSRNA